MGSISSNIKSQDPYSVVVIGGGIGGLVAALWFRKVGCEVVVVEFKTRSLNSTSAGGLHLSENARCCLDPLGVDINQIADFGHEMTIKRYEDGATVHVLHKQRSHAFLHRTDLLNLLHDRVTEMGIETIFGETFESIDEHPNSVAVHLRNGRTLNADLVIGADGINSKTRSAIPATAAVAARLTGDATFLVDIPKATMLAHPATAALYESGSKPFDFTLGPQRVIVAWTMNAHEVYHLQMCDFGYGEGRAYGEPDGQGTPFVTANKDMAKYRERWADFDEGVRRICEVAESCWKWRIAEVPELDAWGSGSGRVVLLGDAAHAFEPFAGQGAAMAIEDATVLATLIHEFPRSAKSLPKVLLAYEQIRRPRIDVMRKIIKCNIQSFALPDGEEQAARDRDMANGEQLEWSDESRYEWMEGYDAIYEAKKYCSSEREVERTAV